MDEHYESGLAKLKWSAGGEWSTSLKPAECTAILTKITMLAKRTPHLSEHPIYKRELVAYSGDPGDETDYDSFA